MSEPSPKNARAETRLQEGIRLVLPIFVTATVFSFFINLLMFVSPLYMLQIYDRVVTSRSETTLMALTILAGSLIFVYAILQGIRSRLFVRAGLLFDEKISGHVFEAVHKGNIRVPNGGHLQCLRDMDVLREFLTGSGLISLCDAPWFPIFVAACFLLHPWFGFIALGGSILTLGLTLLNEMVTKKELDAATTANARASQNANAVFRNTEVLQAMGMIQPLKKLWLDLHGAVLSSQAKASDRAAVIIALTQFSRMFLQTIILCAGAYLVIHGEISAGAIVASSILIGRAMQPIETAVANWKGFITARSAYARLQNLFAAVGSEPRRMSLPRPRGALEISHLLASAPGREQAPILKGITCSVGPGEVIGVIGPSAAGKSTLARVLVGVWPVLRGSVRLDGNDLSHWDSQQLGQYVGYLPQDVELFAGTVAQNIARFQSGDSESVIKAAAMAGCHELIQKLAEGYNTQIGEGGQALSGGQRQRIALARALYGQPSLVVLDEPNANLDSAGEDALLQAVKKLKTLHTTVIIISHKINILAAVDKILVMGDGAVQSFGLRDAILQRFSASTVPSSSQPAQMARASLGSVVNG
jgi:ATP-binding cassette subfamily C protein